MNDLRDYWDDTYMPCQLVGCSSRTIQAHKTALRLWGRWPDRVPIAEITSRHLARYSAWLLPGRSAASVNSYIRPILAILNYAARDGDIPKAPTYRKLREPIRSPLAFTKGEFVAVLRVAESLDGTIAGIRACLWWPSFLCAGFETGLRIQAELSIASRDVLLDQRGFFCQAEPQKDKEAAWFPLSPGTMDRIRAIFDSRRERLWPADRNVDTLRARLRQMMADAKIYAPMGACSVFHRLRKSTASYIAAAGGNAQLKMGHSSPSTTKHYLDSRIVRPSHGNDLVPAPCD